MFTTYVHRFFIYKSSKKVWTHLLLSEGWNFVMTFVLEPNGVVLLKMMSTSSSLRPAPVIFTLIHFSVSFPASWRNSMETATVKVNLVFFNPFYSLSTCPPRKTYLNKEFPLHL